MDYGMIDSCVTLVLLFSVGAHNLHKRSKYDESYSLSPPISSLCLIKVVCLSLDIY